MASHSDINHVKIDSSEMISRKLEMAEVSRNVTVVEKKGDFGGYEKCKNQLKLYCKIVF